MVALGNGIYRGSEADIPAIEPLIRDAHPRMGVPYSVEAVLATIRLVMGDERGMLLIAGDPPAGFAWAQVLEDGKMVLHQTYMSPGQPFEPLADAIVNVARERSCRTIVWLSYRSGMAELAKKFGANPVAILYEREVN